MKTIFSLGLLLSLALNCALAFLVISGRAPTPAARPAAVVAPAAKASRVSDELWSELKSDDPRQLAERLKAAGFPARVVYAIVAAQIRAPYEAQIRALRSEQTQRPFWKTVSGRSEYAQLGPIYRQAAEAVRAVLGAPPDDDAVRTFAYLPDDKAETLRGLLRTFDERRTDLFSGDFNYTVDRDKLAALEKEQRDALAAVLSPSELHDYDVRTSNTARSLRQRLAVFKPSEAEFDAIYDLQAAFDEKYSNYAPGLSQDEMRRRFEEQKNLTAAIKAALAPERAAMYERETDTNYVRTAQLVARLELPAQTVDDLYGLQKEFEQRRMEVARSSLSNREEYMEKMKAMQQEAAAKAKALLGGDRGFQAYQQYGGSWLNNLGPRTTPSTTTGTIYLGP